MRRGFSRTADKWVVALAVLATLTTGCGKNDTISQAEKKDVATGVAAPGIAETKAIAEEGFIYGLPLVMNYAVMNEFAVDTKSGQFKAPFNEINNEHHVATYEDTAVITPNSDTPYSIALAGSARGADGDLGAGGGEGALLLGAADRRQYLQLWLHRQPRHGQRAGRLSRRRPGLEGRDAAGIKKVFSSTTPFALTLFRTQLFNPADMPNVEKVQAGYKAQPLSAFLKQPAPPAAPKIDFLPATTAGIKDELLRVSRRRAPVRAPSAEDKEIRARLATIGIGPGKTFEFKDLSAGTQGRRSCWP